MRTILIATIALLVLAFAGARAAERSLVVKIAAMNGSGENGTATFIAQGDRTLVVVDLQNGTATRQPSHLHDGTCDDYTPRPAYPLSDVVNGRSRTVLTVPFDRITSGRADPERAQVVRRYRHAGGVRARQGLAVLTLPVSCSPSNLKHAGTLLLVLVLFVVAPKTASATQLFAKETMLSCQACHTTGMGLTPLGKGFRNSNLRLMKLTKSGPAIALRGQMAFTSEPDPTGLPKVILDEVDDFVAGQIGDNISYFADIYNVDGGFNGAARELWVEYASGHQRSRAAYRFTVGLMALPTPVDPESFRELNVHYAVWDQTVGGNTFNFFDPHNAAMFTYGSPVRGTSISLVGVQAHDKQSGLNDDGTDTMMALKHIAGPLELDAYRYDGRRSTGAVGDSFWRTGLGAGLLAGRFQLLAVSQSGFDSSPQGDGVTARSGGGFVQTRYQLSQSAFALMRYDGVEDSLGTFSRSFTAGAGVRVGEHFKLELEDVMQHIPQTKHTLNIVFGFGFSNVSGSQAY